MREPIKYKGVGGKVRVQEWGKKVSVVVPGGSTSWTAYQSRSGKTNSRSKQNSRLASKNFIKKGRNELACVEHT